MTTRVSGSKALAGDQADERVVDEFSQWLYAETDGQPVYVQAILEALLERRVLSTAAHEPGLIEFQAAVREREALLGFMPEGVRDVILARLAQLRPNEFVMLSAAAILGKRFNLELLRRVSDLPEDKALSALEQLLASRLLREHQGEEEQSAGRPYLFAHDKIQDVVYTESGSARQGILHRRALEALTNTFAHAAELAHHALAAGMKADAFRQSVAAGDEAMKVVGTQEAITHYSRAHELVEE
ncbi:MAG: hypothetical protein GTO49_16710, partial [Anaerolineae bacterium]|nr:hypothetical protein [Anaerolineae bacterium]